jgi:general secretion pathway protein A
LSKALLGGLIISMGGALAVSVYQMNQVEPRVEIAQKTIVKRLSPVIPSKQVTLPKDLKVPTDAKPTVVLPTTLEFSRDVPRSRSRSMAYAALFRAWNVDFQEGSDPCHQAETVGLNCLTAKGGLEELRKLNMPAVLYLLDNQGQAFYATLIKLNDESATFAAGIETREVQLAALASQWSGNYTLLLHLPPDVHDTILIGSKGNNIQWLRKHLALAQDRTVEATSASLLDDDLKKHVKQFQLSQGLIPDGTVGPQTLARLSAITDQSAPKLSQLQARK